MKILWLFLPIFIFLFFLLSGQVSNVLAAEEVDQKTDKIIIKYKENTSETKKEEIKRKVRVQKDKKIETINSEVVKIDSSRNQSQVIEEIEQEAEVEYVEPDYKAYKFETPNDSFFNKQWGLLKIQAPKAWDISAGSSSVVIAVVDTGINSSHPDLSSKIAGRANFTNEVDFDGDGHGTHVAGIIAASSRNSLGVAGTCMECRLLSVKVLDSDGAGYYSWIASGIIWAADNGALVINLSLGGSASQKTMQDAVNYAASKGVLVVGAAGNKGSKSKMYPGAYESVLAVGATDDRDRKASFSSYGDWVDVAAPGVSIYSTYQDDYTNLSGTSMAAPHVAGLAGLVFSKNSGWTSTQVRGKIESSSDTTSDTGRNWVYGRINACKALDCVESVSTSPSPSPSVKPSPTPQASPTPKPTPTPKPSPTPRPKPGWCHLIPNHRLCQ